MHRVGGNSRDVARIIRNRVELHAWTLMRTGFGENLWCSNNDHAYPSVELINADPVARGMYPLFREKRL